MDTNKVYVVFTEIEDALAPTVINGVYANEIDAQIAVSEVYSYLKQIGFDMSSTYVQYEKQEILY